MKRLIIVRNGHSQQSPDKPFGDISPLSDEGIRRAEIAGHFLKGLVKGPIDGIFYTYGVNHSKSTALTMIGAAGWSSPIRAENAFRHYGKTLDQIRETMRAWMEQQTGTGDVIAAMSRKTALATFQAELGLVDAAIDTKPTNHNEDPLPPGCVMIVENTGNGYDVVARLAGYYAEIKAPTAA